MIDLALILAAIVCVIVATAFVCRHFFLLGLQLGRDERALDPGPVVGSLPAVGESSGRHALPDWPGDDATQQLPAVGVVNGEARA